MSRNKKKNVALLIAVAFLLLALFDGWPYGFFTVLRFVVFGATAYVARMAYEEKKEGWVWVFGFIAMLFNPIIPIYLTRETWRVIDSFLVIILLLTILFLKLESKNGSS